MEKTISRVLALAAATAALAACNKEIPGTDYSGKFNEIRFGSNGVKVETRAFAETTNSMLQANGFKVAAVIDNGGGEMFNAAVTYSDGSYGITDQHYYYPSGETMSFYAAYPPSEVVAVGEGGVATLTYAHNGNEDLTVAKAPHVSRQPYPVMMDFEHVLSQVTMTVKTDDAFLESKVYEINITDADGGLYSFRDDKWQPNTTTADYAFFSSSSGQIVTTSAADVGSAMSFMPGTVLLNVKWKCFNKTGGQLVSNNNQTIKVELVKGKHYTLNLTLPSNSSEILFSTSVGAWVNDNRDIKIKESPIPLSFSASGKQILKFYNGICPFNNFDVYLEYSYDGINWSNWNYSDHSNDLEFGTVEHPRVYIRGDNPKGLGAFCTGCECYEGCFFEFQYLNNTPVQCTGNIMSLVNYETVSEEIPGPACFTGLFHDMTALVSAPQLPATILTKCCYSRMFQGCSNLVLAPQLPAPVLKADCYSEMFKNCSCLQSVTMKATDVPDSYCIYDWLKGAGTSAVSPTLHVDPSMVGNSLIIGNKGAFAISGQ